MAVPLILGGLALAGSIYKGISGYNQAEEGKDMMKNLHRPKYTTPDEIFQNVNMAKNAYLDQTLPGQAVAENKIQGNTSQAIQLAQMYGRSPAEIMAVISGANSNQNTAYNDLATKAAQQQIIDRQMLNVANKDLALSKDNEFNINQLQPYNQDRQFAQDMIGAGNKNLYGAVNDVASLGISALGGWDDSLEGLYTKFFGKGRKKTMGSGGIGAAGQADDNSYDGY